MSKRKQIKLLKKKCKFLVEEIVKREITINLLSRKIYEKEVFPSYLYDLVIDSNYKDLQKIFKNKLLFSEDYFDGCKRQAFSTKNSKKCYPHLQKNSEDTNEVPNLFSKENYLHKKPRDYFFSNQVDPIISFSEISKSNMREQKSQKINDLEEKSSTKLSFISSNKMENQKCANCFKISEKFNRTATKKKFEADLLLKKAKTALIFIKDRKDSHKNKRENQNLLESEDSTNALNTFFDIESEHSAISNDSKNSSVLNYRFDDYSLSEPTIFNFDKQNTVEIMKLKSKTNFLNSLVRTESSKRKHKSEKKIIICSGGKFDDEKGKSDIMISNSAKNDTNKNFKTSSLPVDLSNKNNNKISTIRINPFSKDKIFYKRKNIQDHDYLLHEESNAFRELFSTIKEEKILKRTDRISSNIEGKNLIRFLNMKRKIEKYLGWVNIENYLSEEISKIIEDTKKSEYDRIICKPYQKDPSLKHPNHGISKNQSDFQKIQLTNNENFSEKKRSYSEINIFCKIFKENIAKRVDVISERLILVLINKIYRYLYVIKCKKAMFNCSKTSIIPSKTNFLNNQIIENSERIIFDRSRQHNSDIKEEFKEHKDNKHIYHSPNKNSESLCNDISSQLKTILKGISTNFIKTSEYQQNTALLKNYDITASHFFEKQKLQNPKTKNMNANRCVEQLNTKSVDASIYKQYIELDSKRHKILNILRIGERKETPFKTSFNFIEFMNYILNTDIQNLNQKSVKLWIQQNKKSLTKNVVQNINNFEASLIYGVVYSIVPFFSRNELIIFLHDICIACHDKFKISVILTNLLHCDVLLDEAYLLNILRSIIKYGICKENSTTTDLKNLDSMINSLYCFNISENDLIDQCLMVIYDLPQMFKNNELNDEFMKYQVILKSILAVLGWDYAYNHILCDVIGPMMQDKCTNELLFCLGMLSSLGLQTQEKNSLSVNYIFDILLQFQKCDNLKFKVISIIFLKQKWHLFGKSWINKSKAKIVQETNFKVEDIYEFFI